MPPKGVEAAKERYPQQHVRAGRGIPGYLGNVEVYETPSPFVASDGGVTTLKKAEPKADVPSAYAGTNVAGLREMLEERGLDTNGNRGDLVARLEDDDAKG